ncbi:unnamed protein product (mitochondrion) [Plasmodiophora brassicae]|uniref:Uncharacterized protein n=1 Tax=Plasmodiophora brassicae TaxID=37360 RepID=A0A0G4IRL3_PLABS|nr:hypothetical protein PBRA_005903 [Plasmodiophora brassicae]SPQ98335.1 unnamed protein product [Plasmodiophora brassicae]
MVSTAEKAQNRVDEGEKQRTSKTVRHAGRHVTGNDFEPEKHFYPRVLNASLHPMVTAFLNLGNERIAMRYSHLHPGIARDRIMELFNYQPAFFNWAGADLFHVTNEHAQRRMIVIEINSCPSGQKSMPALDGVDDNAETGYHRLLRKSFVTLLERQKATLPAGGLAVVYDKNPMEASGYAAVISELCHEPVYLVEFYSYDPDPPVKWVDGVMHVRDQSDEWFPIRAAFRYVTQKPWTRFPVITKTLVFNPVLACLAGGRNKLVAAKAYDFFNAEMVNSGLQIHAPDTVTDVALAEIPLYVRSMGWHAVVKIPYSNAGQGVFTITSKAELDRFMALDHHYDKFIVQQLVGNVKWSSIGKHGSYYHVGMIPNRKNCTYVADVRMMIGASPDGFRPIAVYGRRAEQPLTEELDCVDDSWPMLGTNLSIKLDNGHWGSDTNRLVLMDRKDFNKLGISIDDLIEGYVQTVMATIAIDKMCKRLVSDDGTFNLDLFSSLNQDEHFIEEMM